jgi:hypothetical protein
MEYISYIYGNLLRTLCLSGRNQRTTASITTNNPIHILNGGQLEARVKYIKWSSDGYKSARTLVNETHLEADIVERALSVLLENNEIAIENPEAGINKLYYQKPKTKWRQKKL